MGGTLKLRLSLREQGVLGGGWSLASRGSEGCVRLWDSMRDVYLTEVSYSARLKAFVMLFESEISGGQVLRMTWVSIPFSMAREPLLWWSVSRTTSLFLDNNSDGKCQTCCLQDSLFAAFATV